MNGNLIFDAPRCESCGQHITPASSASNQLHSLPPFSPSPTTLLNIRNIPSDSDSSDSDYTSSSLTTSATGSEEDTDTQDLDNASGDEDIFSYPEPFAATRLRNASMDENHRPGFDSPSTALSDSQSLLASAALLKDHKDMEKGEDRTTSNTLTANVGTQEQQDYIDEQHEEEIAELSDGPVKATGELEDDDHEGSVMHEATAEQSEDEQHNEPTEENPSLCQYTAKCNTGSRDYRKVISHIFGRNKKCTTQIPESCWIVYCRKHYQRTRYRTSKAQVKTYFNIQFDNLARQLTRMERWGGVRSWTIALRKKERDLLDAEDRKISTLQVSGGTVDNDTVARIHQCRERFLLPYVGEGLTYADVRRLVRVIEQEVARTTATELPGFELLPDIDPEIYPPSGLRKSEDTPSASASSRKRPRSDDASPKLPKRRLIQGTNQPQHREASEGEEDVKRESYAEESAGAQSDYKNVDKSGKNSRTTADVLESGWYAEDKRLKPPPSRSATPQATIRQPADLHKEASYRSAANQKSRQGYIEQTHTQAPTSTIVSKGLAEHDTRSETSWASSGRYDPWPKSTRGRDYSDEVSTPESFSGSRTLSMELKEGTKRSATPVTPASSIGRTKKAGDTQANSKNTSHHKAASSSSSAAVVYRPATPKTPPRGSRIPVRSSTRLPEMRKFPTPQKSRTTTPQDKHTLTPQLDDTLTPKSSRTLTPHADHAPTGVDRTLTPQPIRQSSTASPYRASPKQFEHIGPVSRQLFATASTKNKKDDKEMEAS